MKLLHSIFAQIDRVYDLDLDVNVQDFLLTQEAMQTLGREVISSSVLVEQCDTSEVRLGVYIEETELAELGRLDLTAGLSPESLAALCTAIEELSHFAYIMFNAEQKRGVTQLELELQGEVDKFITSALLIASHNQGRVPMDLLSRVFDGFVVRDGLSTADRERYEAASGFASRYCHHLSRRYLRRSELFDMLKELRRFYRLSQSGKIGRIQKSLDQRHARRD